jgi:uncharacterized protein YkwD
MTNSSRSTHDPTIASGGRRIAAALAGLVAFAALAAVAAPTAGSAPARHDAALAGLESSVLQKLNAVRAHHGLLPLRASTKLAAAAAQHSREMASDGYFQHDSADGTSFSTRIAQWYPPRGFGYWSVGENLLWSSPTVDSRSALALWMHSPEHRANILDARWREIGVAAVHATAGGTYGDQPVTIITTDFGVRR